MRNGRRRHLPLPTREAYMDNELLTPRSFVGTF